MKRILVVEDDTVSAKAYQRLLEGHGFVVDVAHDGEGAIRIFQAQRPDLVLLDLMLPKVPGTEVIRTIRAQQGPQSIPIVVLTNAMLAAMIKVARQAGADICLMKGECSLDQLLAEICKILNIAIPVATSPAPAPATSQAATTPIRVTAPPEPEPIEEEPIPMAAPSLPPPTYQPAFTTAPMFQPSAPPEPPPVERPVARQAPPEVRQAPPYQSAPLFQSAPAFQPAPLFEPARPVQPSQPARNPGFSQPLPPPPPIQPARPAPPPPQPPSPFTSSGSLDSSAVSGRAFRDPFAVSSAPSPARAPAPSPAAGAKPGGTDIANMRAEMRQAFLEGAPQITNALRGRIPAYVKTKAEVDYLPQLFELYQAVEGVAVNAEIAGFVRIERVANALQSLLRELFEESENITASSLRTAAHAAELLANLFERANDSGDATLSALVLVVDDEAISRRAVCSALELAQLKFISVDEPEIALRLCRENRFELIFSDVEMPGKTGFEMCAELRALPLHRATPFVFITGLSGFESRARSALSGGNDLIAKPFLLSELAVKALTYLIKNEFKEKGI